MSTTRAAAAYFAIVFAAGFLLGALRVLIVAPSLGEMAAVALEVPVLMLVSWLTCTAIVRRYRVPAATGPRLAMGSLAFAILMLAEVGLATQMSGLGLSEYLSGFRDVPKQIGLAAQIAFALVPLIQAKIQDA